MDHKHLSQLNGVDCRGVEWTKYDGNLNGATDLSGNTYGHLTALFRVRVGTTKDKVAKWLNLCDCGNYVVVISSSLKSGHTTSCGCAQKRAVSKALTKHFAPGDKINNWTIIEQADGRTGRGAFWRVRCICGQERIVSGGHLRNGTSTSCGCTAKKRLREENLIDLTNKRFGFLTALEPSDKEVVGDVFWKVRCDCGTEKEVSGHNLRRGGVVSCGCLTKSYGETKIGDLLSKNKINFKSQYTFSDLLSPKGSLLRYDFGILDCNHNLLRLIEFDGEQHFQPVDYFGGESGFDNRLEYDNLKNTYALQHDIPLVRIPYTVRNDITIEHLLGEEYLIK